MTNSDSCVQAEVEVKLEVLEKGVNWLIDQALGVAPKVRRGKEHSYWVERMRRDVTLHLDVDVIRAYCGMRMSAAQERVMQRQMRRCSWCRGTMRHYVRLLQETSDRKEM